MLAPLPTERAAYVEARLAMARAIRSPGFPFDEARVRRLADRLFDRGVDPAGARRHLAAVMAASDRTRALRSVRAPTLVLHGADDPVVDRSGGEATAQAIPGARLVMIPGMGHDLPEALWPRLTDEIAAHAGRG